LIPNLTVYSTAAPARKALGAAASGAAAPVRVAPGAAAEDPTTIRHGPLGILSLTHSKDPSFTSAQPVRI